MNTGERVKSVTAYLYLFQAAVIAYDVGHQASFEDVDNNLISWREVGLNMILVLLYKGVLNKS